MEQQTYPTETSGGKEIPPLPAAHSALPWSLSDADDGHTIVSPVFRTDANGEQSASVRGICVMFHRGEDETRANSAMIVRAVNAHAELVGACRAIMPYLSTQTNGGQAGGFDIASMKIREALRRCES